MPAKTVYVSNEDLTLWEQAGVLAERERRSTAWVISQALRMYLRAVAVEQAKQGPSRAQT